MASDPLAVACATVLRELLHYNWHTIGCGQENAARMLRTLDCEEKESESPAPSSATEGGKP